LPTREEWEGLLNQAVSNGCTVPGPFIPDTEGFDCWSEGDPFSAVQSDLYASSSEQEDNPDRAWAARLDIGIIVTSGKNFDGHFAWPVREVP
jgi:hypothetical protein